MLRGLGQNFSINVRCFIKLPLLVVSEGILQRLI